MRPSISTFVSGNLVVSLPSAISAISFAKEQDSPAKFGSLGQITLFLHIILLISFLVFLQSSFLCCLFVAFIASCFTIRDPLELFWSRCCLFQVSYFPSILNTLIPLSLLGSKRSSTKEGQQGLPCMLRLPNWSSCIFLAISHSDQTGRVLSLQWIKVPRACSSSV